MPAKKRGRRIFLSLSLSLSRFFLPFLFSSSTRTSLVTLPRRKSVAKSQTLFFGAVVKTKENPKIGELIEKENFELSSRKERNYDKEQKKYYRWNSERKEIITKKDKNPISTECSTCWLLSEPKLTAKYFPYKAKTILRNDHSRL